MVNEERWFTNYEALKAHVLETGHFPNKHDKRLNWYKYNAKLIKQGKLSPEREKMIHELEGMRSGEHTGGRRKASHDDVTAYEREMILQSNPEIDIFASLLTCGSVKNGVLK